MFSDLINLIKAYRNRLKPQSELLNMLKDIEIGCSFDPFHQVFYEKNVDPLKTLEYIHKKLEINNIRLGIRWSKVDKGNKIDFTEYKPYFDYCFTNNINVVINVGPIKTMRWPEEHIPDKFKHSIKPKDTITIDHAIAEYAFRYLYNLLTYLKLEYSNHFDKVFAVQGDNELFNRFGEFKVKISSEFEHEVIKIIAKTFPDKPIFINSAGLNDLKKIFDLLEGISGQRIVGINYYYKTAIHHRIPIINKLDNLIIKNLFAVSVSKLKRIAATKGYLVEVSELQGEPWWPNALTPGNKFNEFVFTLLRSKYLKPQNQSKLLVRYWGIEDFAAKFLTDSATKENIAIKDLIISINKDKEY